MCKIHADSHLAEYEQLNVCVLISVGSHFVENEQLNFCVLINTDLHLAEIKYMLQVPI